MPQKTARKSTIKRRTNTTTSSTRRNHKKPTLSQRIRGFIKKKMLLISAGVIVVIGLGVGGYALWQNLSANAAGGWTRVGSINAGWGDKKQRLVGDVYVCKTAVVKQGYKFKAQLRVTSSTRGVNPAENAWVLVNGAEASVRSPKAGTVVTTGYSKPISVPTINRYNNPSMINVFGGFDRGTFDNAAIALTQITNC